jgi:hypothetical protein
VTQILAAAILAGGAFYGVYKGAIYAIWRLEDQLTEQKRLFDLQLDAESTRLQQQLDAQAVRLERQLEAESERLERQLDAERERADRSELRNLIDGGAALMARAVELRQEIEGDAKAVIQLKPGEIDTSDRLPRLTDAERLVNELGDFWQRLALRFRTSDAIPRKASETRKALEAAVATLNFPAKDLRKENIERFQTADERFNEAHAAFLFECRSRFGIQDQGE